MSATRCSCISHWQDGEEHEALRYVVDVRDPDCQAKHPAVDERDEPRRY